jgi:hypothetical protein
MKILAALMAMALIGPTSAAERKLDILGFSPGMPADTFKDRLAALKCETDTCKFDGKVIQFRRAPDKSITQVAYRFTSALKPRDQIVATAKEYGVQTRKSDIGDIGYAMGRYEDLPIIGSRLMTGGPICRWKLADGRTLVLSLDMPGEPMTYILYLADDKQT